MPWYIGVAGCLGVIVGSALAAGVVFLAFWLWDHRPTRRRR